MWHGLRPAQRSLRCVRLASNVPSLARYPKKMGLYDPAREVDSCGVGMVAHLQGKASHKIVSDANVMLVRMAHRGGCGCDPASGVRAQQTNPVAAHAPTPPHPARSPCRDST
jgi:hypothetical protein